MKIIKTSLITIFALAILAEMLYLFALPPALNYALKKGIVEKIIKKETGLALKTDELKVRTTLGFNAVVEVKNAVLRDANNEKILDSEQIKTKISIPSLIFQTPEIKNLYINRSWVRISRDEKNDIYLGTYKLDKNQKINLKLKNFRGEITNTSIIYKDLPTNDEITSRINFHVKKYRENKYLNADFFAKIYHEANESSVQFHIDSRLPLLKHLEKASITGSVENLDISAYSGLISIYLPEITELKGHIRAVFYTKATENDKNKLCLVAHVKDSGIFMKNPDDSIRAEGTTDVKFEGFANEKDLNISKLDVYGDDWQAKITGIVKKIGKKTPELDLNVKIPKSSTHSLVALLPNVPDTDNATRKLKTYGVFGEIEADLKVKGNPERPDIFGKMALSDLYILYYDPRIPKCRIDMEFKGQFFDLYTKVFARKDQFVEIKGSADNWLGGKGNFHIASSPVVDLKTAHRLLLPVHDVVGFDLGPLPYMTISGTGNIDLKVHGTVVDGFANGYFNFKNTDAQIDGYNFKLLNAAGRLDFKEKDMFFETTQGKIKNSAVKITGNADLTGNVDFKVKSDSFDISELLSIAKTSKNLKSKAELLAPVEKAGGNCGVELEIKGFGRDFIKVMEKAVISGKISFKNNSAKSVFAPIEAKKINGTANFNNDDWNADLNTEILSSKFFVKAKSYKNELSASISAPALNLDAVLNSPALRIYEKGDFKNFPPTNSVMELKADYKGSAKKIEKNKIKMKGTFKPSRGSESPFVISSGSVELFDGDLSVKNFRAKVFNSTAKLHGKIIRVFSEKPVYNYDLSVMNFDVANFERLKTMHFMPQYMQKILNTYEKYAGRADVNLTCRNNSNRGKIKLQQIAFVQKSLQIPINVDSGEIHVDGDKILLKSINAKFDNNPIFMNSSVTNLAKNPGFNGYITTKLTESFINKYVNSNLTYPLKVKGDITFTSEFSGDDRGITVKPVIKLNEDADIYYMGASLGDAADKREITGNIHIKNGVFDIRKLTYLRYMTSQNDYSYPLEILTVYGKAIQAKNKFFVKNLHILTKNNANVKIFNAFFKKSVLKQGMFNCSLVLNGDINAPDILGSIKMDSIDMPLYDTIINDININFAPKIIDLEFSGKSYDSDFLVNAQVQNKTTLPVSVDNVKISSKKVNLDSIIDSMTRVTLGNIGTSPTSGKLPEEKLQISPSDIIIKIGRMEAENIILRGLPATNYTGNFNIGKDNILKISNINLNLTGGTVQGSASYNFKNAKITAELQAENVDANRVADAFLDVKNQIFGSVNASIHLSTHGDSEDERIKNANGNVYFSILDGKMPKLGSLEYLLKAGNLIKSGITGLSINNFLDLIAPVKTGYFDSIKGSIHLKNGSAENLEIFSTGDNLSLYIKGKYDFPEQNADLIVFGRLTKKSQNILGPVGNASFNSLLNLIPGIKLDRSEKSKILTDLNKIPGVEFDDQTYRIFSAKIDGDVNGEKYVTYFKWIE